MNKCLLCTVSFSKAPNAKAYSYYTNIEDLVKGELVMVHANDTVAPAYFNRYFSNEDLISREVSQMKWLISRIDLNPYLQKLEVISQQNELYNKLEEEIKTIDKEKLYKTLAKDNTNIAALLECLEELKNN